MTDPATINVTGTGRVSVSPDLADLTLGVTITAKTVAAARAANGKAMQSLLASLTARGIASADIQTSNLSLSPTYDYSRDQSPPRLVGYTLANSLAVTIRDLEQLGPTIDGALEAGATGIDQISFRIADPAPAEREARASAVADARSKADVLAGAAGVTIVRVATITEGGAPTPFPMHKMEMAMAAHDVSTPIETGTNQVVVTVAVTYIVE